MDERHTSVQVTARQESILALIAEGYSNQQIAERLGISENGVKGHVARLLAKFGVPNRAGLVHAAQGSERPDPTRELLLVLKTTLEDVVGETAALALLKRAGKRAALPEWNPTDPPRGLSNETVQRLVAALWPLLIEMTGTVLIGRLERQGGLLPGGDFALGEG